MSQHKALKVGILGVVVVALLLAGLVAFVLW